MNKVLITGSLGQLGQELQLNAPPHTMITAVDICELDIANRDDVLTFVKELKPDLIINAAAYTAVDKAESEPDISFAVNRDGPGNLAFAARDISARLIHVSTDYVFDGSSPHPYMPRDKTCPLGVYGQSKLQGEEKIRDLIPRSSVIVRTAWLYSSRGNNFLKTMLKLMSSRDSISVVADQIGTPTSSITLAETIWRFAEKKELSGVYHFTDNGLCSWYDFAMAIMEEALSIGLLTREVEILPISTSQYPMPAKRPACSLLDKSSTFDDLSIKGVHWRKALRRVMNDIKQNS